MSKRKPTGVRKEKLPAASVLVRSARKDKIISTPMSMEEKIQCLDLFAQLKDAAAVAVKMNRSEDGVRKFLWRYQSTTTGARLTLEAGAERLANRIVKNANVEESMEVLDRLNVLNAKRDKSAPASSFNLIIGMPSTSAAPASIDVVPVPDQKRIDESIVDAEVKVVADGPSPT